MAAPSSQPKTALKGTITFSDGTGTPVTLMLAFCQGDASLGPLSEDLNEPVLMTARSLFVGLSRGAPRYPQLTFTALVGNVVGADAIAPGAAAEFVTGKGAYTANISTLGANRKMTVDIILTIEGTDWGDSADEIITCEDCLVDFTWQEAMDGNTLSFSAQVLGAVVIENDANTVTLAQAA